MTTYRHTLIHSQVYRVQKMASRLHNQQDNNSNNSDDDEIAPKRQKMEVFQENTKTDLENDKIIQLLPSITESPLSYLPATVLSQIFSKIPEKQRLQEVQFVSKRWRHILNTSSACWNDKRFKLDRPFAAQSQRDEYEYMLQYLSRYGQFLTKLTISMNNRIKRENALKYYSKISTLINEKNLKFYCLKCFSMSNLRLDRKSWDDRRTVMVDVFVQMLERNLPMELERLHIHDLLLHPRDAVRVLEVLTLKFKNLVELDIEEIVSNREPEEEFIDLTVETPPETSPTSENDETEVESQNNSTPPVISISENSVEEREAIITDLRHWKDIKVPQALGNFLIQAKYLKKLILNYNYLSKSLFDTLLQNDHNPQVFAENLTDFHIRVDRTQDRLQDSNYNHLIPQANQEPPTITQFNKISKKYPNIRFSLSFEKEMRYQKHVQILGREVDKNLIYRLHRLELRGDTFTDTNGSEPSISQTLTKLVPKFSSSLSKLVIDWYSPVEYLSDEIFQVVRKCKNLTVFRIKSFLEFDVVCQLLNLVRFCEDLDHETMSEFEDFPDCVPIDMDNLPKKLKSLKIVRYCYQESEGESEEDQDWAEWREHNHIENEYGKVWKK